MSLVIITRAPSAIAVSSSSSTDTPALPVGTGVGAGDGCPMWTSSIAMSLVPLLPISPTNLMCVTPGSKSSADASSHCFVWLPDLCQRSIHEVPPSLDEYKYIVPMFAPRMLYANCKDEAPMEEPKLASIA